MGVAEAVLAIRQPHPLLDPDGFGEHPAVDRRGFDLGQRNRMRRGIEVGEIAEQEPKRVADLPIPPRPRP